MKKIIFSAIAMVAFVGSSMANDFAEKEIIYLKSEEIITSLADQELILGKDCGVAKFSAYVDAKAEGFTHEQATGMAWNIYFFCMEENSKKNNTIQP